MAYLFSSVIPFLMSADNRNFSYFGNCRKAILANTSSSSILVNIFSSVAAIFYSSRSPPLSRQGQNSFFRYQISYFARRPPMSVREYDASLCRFKANAPAYAPSFQFAPL